MLAALLEEHECSKLETAAHTSLAIREGKREAGLWMPCLDEQTLLTRVVLAVD